MLKLREPFSLKIHLHIGQDMLQRLWDKYVPVSSSVYENIQLVYRNMEAGQEAEQTKQVRLLISLVLKNRLMQMGVEQYPSSLAFGIKCMGGSLRRMEKYYLTQLKGSSLTMFRTLNRYLTILEQEASDNRRYRDWQKEHQIIEKQWEKLRLLSLFSVQVKEMYAERSAQMTRTLEKELFDTLSETEYRILEENSIRQEKDELITWLKTCSETQCQQIVERLEKEADLCRVLALKAGISETEKKEKKKKSKKSAKNKHSKKKNAKIKPEEIGIGQILKLIPGYSEGEKLAAAAELLDEKEFRLFYRQIISSEETDRRLVVWKSSREEMLSYVNQITVNETDMNQTETEKVQQLWTQIDMVFPEKLIRLQEQHRQEFNREFREQILSMVEQEPFLAIADVADTWDAAKPQMQTNNGEAAVLWSRTDLFIRNLEQTQEIWKENIRQQEAKVFETYKEVYQKAFHVRGSNALRQENVKRLVEETFLNQHKESIYHDGTYHENTYHDNIYHENTYHENTYHDNTYHESVFHDSTAINETVRSICEWGRVLLEAFHAEQGQSADSGAEASLETADKERIIKRTSKELSIDLEHQEELVYLLSQINSRLEEEHLYQESGAVVLHENQVEEEEEKEKKETLQKLLTYVHELTEERKTEFVRQLTDAVVLWQKVFISWKSYEEETSDVFSVLKAKTFQTALQRRETERLVEDTFRKRHKENIYRESITEAEIRDICEWGRVVLQSVHTEHRTEITENRETMRFGQTAVLEHEEELVYLIEQMNYHMEEQGVFEKTFKLTWNENQAVEGKIEKLQRLLTYIHELRADQRTKFVRQLTDAVILWQQMKTLRKSYEEESSDVFSVLKEESYQTAAKRKDVELLVEEDFRKQHKENIYNEHITEEEIRNICEWGRVVSESVHTERRTGIETEITDTLWHTESKGMERRVESADIEQRVESVESADMEPYGEAVWKEQNTAILEHEEELVYLLKQVNRRMEEQGIHEETLTLFQIRTQSEEKREDLQKLLSYIHELREEQKTEFIRQLTDAVVIWQQTILSRQSYEAEVLDVFSELKKETDRTTVERRETELSVQETNRTAVERRETELSVEEINQTAVERREAELLVEAAFRVQHKEKIEQEQITKEEIRNICEWSRMVLESADTERRTEITDTQQRTESAETETYVEFIESVWQGQTAVLEHQDELVYLFRQVSRRMEEEGIHENTFTLSRIHNRTVEQREALQKLLTVFHGLGEEQKTEFARQLTDAVVIWQQTITSRQSYKEKVLDVDQEAERLVEETFRRQHKENIYREKITKKEVRNICEWGRVILQQTTDAITYRKAELSEQPKLPEQEEELVYLIRQINHYIEEKSILGEASELIWQENRLEEEKIEKLVTYVRKLEEEQKTEFIGQLADAVLIWQQMNIFRQIFEEETTALFSTSEQKGFPAITKQEDTQQPADTVLLGRMNQTEVLQPDRTEDAETFYRELWECGEALLFYPKQEQAWEEAKILSDQEREVLSLSNTIYQEDIQTQVIRRQIEAAKDRNSLQRLIEQINYQIDSEQNSEQNSGQIDFGQEEGLSLVYADSQLKAPSVQKLISHIRTLDEQQYDILVKELSKVIRFQRTAHSGQAKSGTASDKLRQKFITMQLRENPADAVIKQKETYQVLEAPVFMEHRTAVQLAAAYPGFAWRIQEYERQRQQTVQKELQKLMQTYVYSGAFNQIENSEKIPQLFGESGEILQTPDDLAAFSAALLQTNIQNAVTGNQREHGNPWESNRQMQQDLQYSIRRSDTSDEERQRAELRMQQETIQMKSAQEQLDRKLKEVETQLKKVESSAKAKEDAGVLAEQVKKRLYEELHVEKLRRGLI